MFRQSCFSGPNTATQSSRQDLQLLRNHTIFNVGSWPRFHRQLGEPPPDSLRLFRPSNKTHLTHRNCGVDSAIHVQLSTSAHSAFTLTRVIVRHEKGQGRSIASVQRRSCKFPVQKTDVSYLSVSSQCGTRSMV